jgi:hypothetical protein
MKQLSRFSTKLTLHLVILELNAPPSMFDDGIGGRPLAKKYGSFASLVYPANNQKEQITNLPVNSTHYLYLQNHGTL